MPLDNRKSLPSKVGVGLLILCLTSQSGCITLSSLMGNSKSGTLDTRMLEAQGYSIPPGGMPSPVAPDPSGQPRVILEVRGDERHLEAIPLSHDRPVFIEDIVHQARLHERIGGLFISIMRPDGQGGPPVRLEVQTDDKGRATNAGHNYALLPGDHIVVNSDNRSGFERMIDKQFRRKN